jgi:hypothetical protein
VPFAPARIELFAGHWHESLATGGAPPTGHHTHGSGLAGYVEGAGGSSSRTAAQQSSCRIDSHSERHSERHSGATAAATAVAEAAAGVGAVAAAAAEAAAASAATAGPLWPSAVDRAGSFFARGVAPWLAQRAPAGPECLESPGVRANTASSGTSGGVSPMGRSAGGENGGGGRRTEDGGRRRAEEGGGGRRRRRRRRR